MLSVLAVSLIVSVGSVQAKSDGKLFTYNVNSGWVTPSLAGFGTSSLPWLRGHNVCPICWWPDIPFDHTFVEEDWTDGIFYCHGDWCMECTLEGYEGTFRYEWWVYWSDNPHENPKARNLGGEFTFSEGTGDLAGMYAYGITWVGHGGAHPSPIQHHIGIITGAP